MNTNKIDLIKAEVVEIVNSINLFLPDEDGKNSYYEAGKLDAATQILQLIDSLEESVRRTSADIESAMQEVEEKSKAFTEAHKGESADEILDEMRGEKPVSIWHDASEEPNPNMELICVGQYGNPLVLSSNSDSFKSRDISKWAYFNDLINLSNVQRTVKDWKEEPVSEELEKASMEWLRPQLDVSYKAYSEGKQMELTHFDGYAMLDAIEFGAKWQEKKDQSIIELAEDHAMFAGMEKMKEQMVANGVDGVVHHFEKCEVASVHYNDPTGVPMSYFMSSKGFLAGDKVKIIVIKEG